MTLSDIFKWAPDFEVNHSLVEQDKRGIIMDAMTAAEPQGGLPPLHRIATIPSAPAELWNDPDFETYMVMQGYIAIAKGVIGLLPEEKVKEWEALDD
jgi:hypothetical protein